MLYCGIDNFEELEPLLALNREVQPEEQWIQQHVKVHAVLLPDFYKAVSFFIVLAAPYCNERDYVKELLQLVQLFFSKLEFANVSLAVVRVLGRSQLR